MQERIALEELNRDLSSAQSRLEKWAIAKVTSAMDLKEQHLKLVDGHKGSKLLQRESATCMPCLSSDFFDVNQTLVALQVILQIYKRSKTRSQSRQSLCPAVRLELHMLKAKAARWRCRMTLALCRSQQGAGERKRT